MLTFFGMGKINPEKAKEFKKALQAYRSHLLAEEGTVEYIVYRGTKDPLQTRLPTKLIMHHFICRSSCGYSKNAGKRT